MRPILQAMGTVYQALSGYDWFKSVEIDKNSKEIIVVTNGVLNPENIEELQQHFPNNMIDNYRIAGRIEKDE